MTRKKGNWKSKTKEEKQKELDDLLDISNKKIEQYQSSPEDMIEFAKFMSKIHNYSALNLSLIDEQFKGAIAVSSYEGWNKLGFSVQRGEKGIGIYAHAPVTIFTNKAGEEKTLREATAEEKTLIRNGILPSKKINHFKKGYVYDVSQTNATAEDLPKIFPNQVWNFDLQGENSIDQLESGVSALASSIGIDIKDMKESIYGELGSARGAYIQYVGGEEEITLNSRNSRTQNIATSIHELAHKKLHSMGEEGFNYPTEIKEFQAEMTSFVVCHNYGMDTSEKAIPYVAQWTKNNEKIDPKLFRQVMNDVRKTAIEFMEKIDEVIISERAEIESNKYYKMIEALNEVPIVDIEKDNISTVEKNLQEVLEEANISLVTKNEFMSELSEKNVPLEEMLKNLKLEEQSDIHDFNDLPEGLYVYDKHNVGELAFYGESPNEIFNHITDIGSFYNSEEVSSRWYDYSGIPESFGVSDEVTNQTIERFKQNAHEQAQQELTALKNTFAVEESKEKEQRNLIFRDQTFSSEDFDTFRNGNFDNTRFENCTFDKILMSNSSFKNTVFADCKFNFADLSNSDLKDSTIYYSEFIGGSLKNSNLENATIRSTRITNTNLSNAELLIAKFEDVSFNDVQIGQSIRHLETVGMYVRGGTREECERYKEIVMDKLVKENFNDSFDIGKMDLEYSSYYEKTINDPDRVSHGSYLESMVDYYQNKLGIDSIVLDYGDFEGDVTASIGKNYVTYFNDTKQFDICDVYGVTAENTSVNEYDRLLLDRSPENCDYVEAFLRESIKAYDKYEVEQNNEKTVEADYRDTYTKPLRTVVIDESIAKLSNSSESYNSLSSWYDEVTNQSDVNTIKELKTIDSIDNFYNIHKQEIENKIDDFVAVTNIDVRKGLNNEEYKDHVSVIAYKLTATNLKKELEEGSFEIPKNDLLITRNQEIEME